jgi:hypothetical protein
LYRRLADRTHLESISGNGGTRGLTPNYGRGACNSALG